jgi:predicted HTH transcriptional regulator
MSVAEFRRAFPGESQHVEFKRGTSMEQLQNTAVAFSNADGGVLLIGVQDDGAIAARALDAGTQDDIHRAMQAARDVGRYGLSQLDVDGKPVTVLSLARRREGFAQTSAGVVRVRRGTRDDPLFGAELDRIALVHAARGETLTNKRVRQLAAVDAHAARDVLHRLRDQGFLEQHGQRGGASYRLSGTLRPPAGLRLSPEELADVVAQLAAGGAISNSDVRAATRLDRAEVLGVLDRLVREGRLVRTGQRRGAKYHRP